MADGPTGPLRGIRIVDFTQALAGPFCTMLLADLGADVVKVEPPSGDMTRFSGPLARGDADRYYGGYFASINRNKRSVVLDLKSSFGVEAALALCRTADAVVENSRSGVMDELGLSWEVLHEQNPKLVYAAIRGFGDARTGASPYTDWPAFDVVAQAMGGSVGMTGSADGQAYKVGPSIGDLYPATLTALGVSAALVHARSTGEGQFLDVAMYDAVLALCEAIVYRWSYGEILTRPAGNGHPALCPMDLFPTSDGACAIAAPTERHWPLLARLIGRPDLVDDPRSRTNRDRVANGAFVREAIGAWTRQRTKAEVASVLGGQVPVGPLHTAPDVFADPHVAARNMLVDVPHPGAPGPMTVAGSPIHLTATPAGIYRRAPMLGEHTAELLAEAGVELPADPSAVAATQPAPKVRL